MHRQLHLAPPPSAHPVVLKAGPRRVLVMGDLDAFSGRSIEPDLLAIAEDRQAVVIDLSGVDVLTSGGLAVLERCLDHAAALGHAFLLVVPPATLAQRVLAFAGVGHHVLHPDHEPRPVRQRRPERTA